MMGYTQGIGMMANTQGIGMMGSGGLVAVQPSTFGTGMTSTGISAMSGYVLAVL